MGIWGWLRRRFPTSEPPLFNLVIQPAYVIKASPANPYFKALEQQARDTGFLGTFVVHSDGRLRPGTNNRLPTLNARLQLDVYPNPAAIEGRAVPDYADHRSPRRVPRATLLLDDDSELFLWFEGTTPRVAGRAVDQAATPPNTRPGT